MRTKRPFVPRFMALLLAATLTAAQPSVALAWGGFSHQWAADQAITLMCADEASDITSATPMAAVRARVGAPIYPELWLNSARFSYWAYMADNSMNTINHFWEADDGLHECPEGWLGFDNAWEKAETYWDLAQTEWWLGNTSGAYIYLAHALHLLQDGGQPAHTNSDLHPVEDSLEEWFDHPDLMYAWSKAGVPDPGHITVIPTNQQIINKVLAANSWQPGQVEFVMQPDLVLPNGPLNKQQLFYLMYVVNQSGNYFASDGEGGNKTDAIGWLAGYPGFPGHLHYNDAGISPQNENALSDNEIDCPNNNPDCGDSPENRTQCNCDGDLRTIAKAGYGAAFRATPALIDAFRRSVDNMPPVTDVETTRADGQPVATWNNSNVTVHLAGAIDQRNPAIRRASGVWKLWGLCDGRPPANENDPAWTISTTGIHTVKVRTTDLCGNIEKRDISVGVDKALPSVTLTGWRTGYLRCESQKATWTVKDANSGVQSVSATIDTTPVVVNSTVDMSKLSVGAHTLRVRAYDKAGNLKVREHVFTVLGHVGLAVGKPAASLRTGRTYSFSGTLHPRHRAGTTPVTLVFSRAEKNAWVVRKRETATIGVDGKYRKTVRMLKGRWRVRAEHSTPRVVSSYRYMTIS